jgi:hypothetical protein
MEVVQSLVWGVIGVFDSAFLAQKPQRPVAGESVIARDNRYEEKNDCCSQKKLPVIGPDSHCVVSSTRD